MATLEELTQTRSEGELSTISPIEVIKQPNGSLIPAGETVMSGLDKVVREGYRRSVRDGAMSSLEAARSYRGFNPDSVLIPEDFE